MKKLCSDFDNINIIIGDARNKSDLVEKLKNTTFDLIIDDGSHVSEDIVATFQSLWKRVNSGGYYIVEDLRCTYNPNYAAHMERTFGEKVENSRSTILSLMDTLMKSCDMHKNNIAEIKYYPQLLVIKKT